MSVMLKSSEVQQNFGRIMEQAMMQDDVVVERYGKPRVVILDYRRYQQLLQAEQDASRPYLMFPNQSPEAQERGRALAEQVRKELEAGMNGTLEEVMVSLRGRT